MGPRKAKGKPGSPLREIVFLAGIPGPRAALFRGCFLARRYSFAPPPGGANHFFDKKSGAILPNSNPFFTAPRGAATPVAYTRSSQRKPLLPSRPPLPRPLHFWGNLVWPRGLCRASARQAVARARLRRLGRKPKIGACGGLGVGVHFNIYGGTSRILE